MKKPKVSVIIIQYNNFAYTKKAIQCVQKSTFTNYEIIVVDDASPDDSVLQIEKKFPDVHIVRLKKSLGRAAMNEGMNVAKGEIFLFLDADMFLRPNFLKNLVEKFDKYKSVNAVAFNLRDPSGQTLGWEPIHAKEKTPEGGYETMTATVAIRRSVYEKVGGFDPNFFLYVEYEYYLTLLRNEYNVLYFPDLVADHGETPNPYRSVMKSYHVVKNHLQIYALYLPVRVWPNFIKHHTKEFTEIMITGKANRIGTIKGLFVGLWFFVKALRRRRVLTGKPLETFMRFYFPKRGDIVIEKWGWK